MFLTFATHISIFIFSLLLVLSLSIVSSFTTRCDVVRTLSGDDASIVQFFNCTDEPSFTERLSLVYTSFVNGLLHPLGVESKAVGVAEEETAPRVSVAPAPTELNLFASVTGNLFSEGSDFESVILDAIHHSPTATPSVTVSETRGLSDTMVIFCNGGWLCDLYAYKSHNQHNTQNTKQTHRKPNIKIPIVTGKQIGRAHV